VLQRLYPEGPAICHHVLVHPPGGIVAGDRLELEVELGEGAQALLTTPGATRFYRSEGAPGTQQVRLRLAAGARLEWLPQETLAYSGCAAENRIEMALEPGAQLLGWDLLALGLPAAQQPFVDGWVQQHLALADAGPGWLERGRIAASDTRLLHSPLGLNGQGVLATAWWCEGSVMSRARREQFLDVARAALAGAAPALQAGATSPHERVIVVRALGPRVEPVMQALRTLRAAWRAEAWGLPAAPPRIWRT
jgi:urease accessory protein